MTAEGVATGAPDPAPGVGAAAGVGASGRPLRAGIVGAGFMGRVHARSIRVTGAHLVGVTASTSDRSRAAALALGADRGIADAMTLVAADDIDVVHVCTPNHLHAEVTLAALEAGKHVVCEKPLATAVDDAERMAGLAVALGRVATVPFVYRFYPTVREARTRVQGGGIGAVGLVHGSYLQDWLLHPSDDNWRVDAERGGQSRAFSDIGSHWCDLLEFVTGDRIESVTARLATVNGQRGLGTARAVSTEDVAMLQFVTAAGVLGSCVISQVSAGRKNRLLLEVSGAEATLAFDQEDPERLWFGERSRSGYLLRDPDAMGAAAAGYARLPAGHPQGYQDCFDSFVADTYAAIAGDEPDGLPTFADGLRAARLADAVVRSAADATWVEVG